MDKLRSFGESFRRKRNGTNSEDQQQQWQSEEQNSAFPIKYIGSLEVTASKGMPVCETTTSTHSSSNVESKSKLGSILFHSEESLHECLIELVDASECYANAGYYKRSYNCARQAKLIALQIALRESLKTCEAQYVSTNSQQQSNNNIDKVATSHEHGSDSITNVLNLSITKPRELVNTIIGLKDFNEAYIVAEAYDYHLVWHRALFNNVILRGSLQYLNEFRKKCDLSESIITDLVVLYKQYLLSTQNDNMMKQNSSDSRDRRRLSMPAPGGSKRLTTSLSSSSLFLRHQTHVANATYASSFKGPTDQEPSSEKPERATFINDDTDEDDVDSHKNKSKTNDEDVDDDVDVHVDDGKRRQSRRDINYKVSNEHNINNDKLGITDNANVDSENVNEDDDRNELARMASAMKTVLEGLANVRLRFKIYTDLNFADAQEELVNRSPAIAAYLKDLKLV